MSQIEIKSLSKAYDGVTAVDDFNFTAPSGKIAALVGPDGAGKTTILRAVCDLIAPDGGEVLMDGTPVRADRRRPKAAVGYMPQTFALYADLTVEENLVFYGGIYGVVGREYRTRRDELYAFSRLEPFANRRAGALSGGMKQKLALSCALIHQPQVLVLDEPTTGVDPLSRRQLWDILLRFRGEGITVLVSTPYMDEVARADLACFVFDGRLLAEGTPPELSALFEGRTYVVDETPNRGRLEQLNAEDGIRARRFGNAMQLQTTADLTGDQLRAALRGAGLNPDKCRTVPPSLEDTFIQLVRRSDRRPANAE